MAGTTVMCYVVNDRLCWRQSEKKKDADRAIKAWCEDVKPSAMFIDAPLSLPGVYQNLPDHDDYFYRLADRELKAMSPMFLGGLTARAMRLKAELKEQIGVFQEVYPAALARELGLNELSYKKEKGQLVQVQNLIESKLPFGFDQVAENWHQIDSILAWFSGYRRHKDIAHLYGNSEEGIIVV